MKKILSTLILLSLIVVPESPLISRNNNREKVMRCEQICKEQYWRCRSRAGAVKDRKKSERYMLLCDSQHQGCYNRCQRYAR